MLKVASQEKPKIRWVALTNGGTGERNKKCGERPREIAPLGVRAGGARSAVRQSRRRRRSAPLARRPDTAAAAADGGRKKGVSWTIS